MLARLAERLTGSGALDAPMSLQIQSAAVLLFLFGSVASAGEAVEASERLIELRARQREVAGLVDSASGHAAKASRIDLQVAEWFADYVEWEAENPEATMEALVGDRIFHEGEPAGPEVAARRYREHLERQLDGALALVERAEARLTLEREWPGVANPDWERMGFSDGYFRNGDRPVFPAGFNMLVRDFVDLAEHPERREESEARLDRFLLEMRQLGVGVVGQGISLPHFLDRDGRVRREQVNAWVEGIERLTSKGFKVGVLFHWGGDPEVLEGLWPGITAYRANGVAVDIDHPGTRELIRKVCSEILPILAKCEGIVAWDMANEPFFSVEQWSPHTLLRYQKWLQERHGSIEVLNERWRSKHPGFDAIRLPKSDGKGSCSPGEWYDRMSFHRHRVTSFFGLVSDELQRHIPGALVHLKSQDNSSLGPLPESVGHGIDREALTPLCQLQGLDTRPLPVTEPRMAASDYDGSPYALHWLGQSFTYDYLTSLPPSRPIVDFEYHAFSINAIRVPDLPENHGRAALWLAHLQGMVGNMAWYWHRRWGPDPFPEEYFKWWFRASLSTQPLAAAEYFQTMLELNAFSPEVEGLAGVEERPVRLLVSNPSYIQDQAHIDALHRVYEGTCFHGLRVGFVTEDMLVADGVPDDCRVLIIPQVRYLSAEALAGLDAARQQGVGLMIYGDRVPSRDSHGNPHASELTAFLGEIPAIEPRDAAGLSERMLQPLEEAIRDLPIRVQRVDAPDAFGVMHRVVDTAEGRSVLLVNVLSQPLTVRLMSAEQAPEQVDDVLNGEMVDARQINLPVRGVRLIRLRPADIEPRH